MQPRLPDRVAKNIGQLTGRAWLLPKLLEWWEQCDERLFLLTGGPGTGKSMILAWISGFGPDPSDPIARAQLAHLRNVVKAVHFCEASSRNISPQAFAESIANQLIRSAEGFADALMATLADRVQISVTQTAGAVAAGGTMTGVSIARVDLGRLGDELSFDRAFAEPLQKLYASGHDQPMLLLVDALDEAQTYTGITLPNLISRLADLPAPVRMLGTTRDDPRVLKFFRGIKTFDLIQNADPHVNDLRTYVQGRLAGIVATDQAKREDFASRLAKQAGGVFLYATMVLDEALEHSPAGFPDLATYPLPEGLRGLYHDFLTRELGKDEQRWFDLYEPLLGMIAIAQGGGLTTQQLTSIIGTDIRAALRASKQYLSGELPEGPFRVFHKSFADFLFEDEDNTDYHIDAIVLHRRIADHFLVHNRDNWAAAERYALTYIATHLGMSQSWKRLEELLLDVTFVRALCDFSRKALEDAFRWADRCLRDTPKGPRQHLLLRLSEVAQQLRYFVLRQEEIHRIDKFLQTDDLNHLLVVGEPGIGKTAMVANVWLRNFDQCLFARVVAGERGSLLSTFTNMVNESPFFSKGCSSLYDDFEHAFGTILSYTKPLCIIIDELDAARDLQQYLHRFLVALPPNIRFIWASRHREDISSLKGCAIVIQLDRLTPVEWFDFGKQHLPDLRLEEVETACRLAKDKTDLLAQLLSPAI